MVAAFCGSGIERGAILVVAPVVALGMRDRRAHVEGGLDPDVEIMEQPRPVRIFAASIAGELGNGFGRGRERAEMVLVVVHQFNSDFASSMTAPGLAPRTLAITASAATSLVEPIR